MTRDNCRKAWGSERARRNAVILHDGNGTDEKAHCKLCARTHTHTQHIC